MVHDKTLRRWQRLSAKAAIARAKRKREMQRMDYSVECYWWDSDDPAYWDWIDDSDAFGHENCTCELCPSCRNEPNFRKWQEACYCPSCREYRRYNIETLYCTEQPYFEYRAEHW